MQKLSQKTQGIVYVLIAAFGFSLMSMFIKLAGDLPSFEKAFFRNFVALIFITILMLRSRTSFRPERRNLQHHQSAQQSEQRFQARRCSAGAFSVRWACCAISMPSAS